MREMAPKVLRDRERGQGWWVAPWMGRSQGEGGCWLVPVPGLQASPCLLATTACGPSLGPRCGRSHSLHGGPGAGRGGAVSGGQAEYLIYGLGGLEEAPFSLSA